MHDLVDIARLCRKQQNAEHGPEALYRYGHGNNQLTLFRDTHDRAAHAGQRVHHFRIDRAIAARRFLVLRQAARLQHAVEHAGEPVAPGLRLGRYWRQVEAQHLTARIKMSGIEQQIGIGIEQPRAGARWRNQPP